MGKILKNPCDCGGDKCGVKHYDWCFSLQHYKYTPEDLCPIWNINEIVPWEKIDLDPDTMAASIAALEKVILQGFQMHVEDLFIKTMSPEAMDKIFGVKK
jgi:hypothetical protein